MEQQLQKEFEACKQIPSKNIEIGLYVVNDSTVIGASAHGYTGTRKQCDETSDEIQGISSKNQEQRELPHHSRLPSEQAMQLKSSPSPEKLQNPEVPVTLLDIWETQIRRSGTQQYNRQNNFEVRRAAFADIALDNHQMEQLVPPPRTSDPVDNFARSEVASEFKESKVQLIQKSNELSATNVPNRLIDSVVKFTTPRKQSKFYRCAECNKQFRRRDYLTEHLQFHTGEKPYKCVDCNYATTRERHLARHKMIHSDVRPFKCSTCNATFKYKYFLTDHQRTHSDARPFKCSTCNAAFKLKIYLVGHQRTHTDEMQFTCDICKKTFRRKLHLMDHMNIHTGEKPYECNVCNETFSHRPALSNHRKSCHGKQKSSR